MCGRWLAAPPSKTLDKHMSGAELTVTSSLHLGVDVQKGNELCKFLVTQQKVTCNRMVRDDTSKPDRQPI